MRTKDPNQPEWRILKQNRTGGAGLGDTLSPFWSHLFKRSPRTIELLERLSDVSATALLTLYCRAYESRAEEPIQRDPEAERLASELRPAVARRTDPLSRRLAENRIESRLAVNLTLRARYYDQCALAFLEMHPDAVVINLAAGLDTRYHRLGCPESPFYDLDLPPVISLKRSLMRESTFYHFISSSVLETGWMEEMASREGDRPVLFLAEGLFMYLEEREVRGLVLNLQRFFPGCELVAEMINGFWLGPPFGTFVNWCLRMKLGLGPEAHFRFGIRSSREMESWGDGIRYLSDWSFVDEPEPKLGLFRWMRYLKPLRLIQWSVHYRLG